MIQYTARTLKSQNSFQMYSKYVQYTVCVYILYYKECYTHYLWVFLIGEPFLFLLNCRIYSHINTVSVYGFIKLWTATAVFYFILFYDHT